MRSSKRAWLLWVFWNMFVSLIMWLKNIVLASRAVRCCPIIEKPKFPTIWHWPIGAVCCMGEKAGIQFATQSPIYFRMTGDLHSWQWEYHNCSEMNSLEEDSKQQTIGVRKVRISTQSIAKILEINENGFVKCFQVSEDDENFESSTRKWLTKDNFQKLLVGIITSSH